MSYLNIPSEHKTATIELSPSHSGLIINGIRFIPVEASNWHQQEVTTYDVWKQLKQAEKFVVGEAR